MQIYSWLAVSIGAVAGALLRWRLGIWLNAMFPTIPPGTVAANLIAGFLIGVAVELFAQYSSLAPELRLLFITGFLGGLSTFSTFSAEVVLLLEEREYAWAVAASSVHLFGSIVMTIAGIFFMRALFALEATR